MPGNIAVEVFPPVWMRKKKARLTMVRPTSFDHRRRTYRPRNEASTMATAASFL
ncbi:hypothetical protein D3C71_2027170 [compost metagenome]